jgi:hypothetical protein
MYFIDIQALRFLQNAYKTLILNILEPICVCQKYAVPLQKFVDILKNNPQRDNIIITHNPNGESVG